MSCDMSFDSCLIEARIIVFDVCGKRERGIIRNVEDLDAYIFEFACQIKLYLKTLT